MTAALHCGMDQSSTMTNPITETRSYKLYRISEVEEYRSASILKIDMLVMLLEGKD